ncbi:MAG: pyruvate formate lyase family protein, partial [Lentisphaerota bacterium]
MAEGFDAMERELTEELAACGKNGTEEERQLLLALGDYATGVRAFHARTVMAARQAADGAAGARAAELRAIADALESAFHQPAQTFYTGLLALNFTWMLDFCDGIGRVDQVLGALY